MSLSIANHHASLPVAYRLYLPEAWEQDAQRRRKAGVPREITFQTKPEIALEQIRAACEAGLPRGIVLMDAGYGANTDLRTNITALGLSYVAGIMPNTTVWTPGKAPLRAKKWSGNGRPPKLIRRDRNHQPIPVKELALCLPARAWRTIAWREGLGREAHLALCAATGSRCTSRLQSHQGPPGRMAADRVAQGRERADQILALDGSRKHRVPSFGRSGQAALAHRARLSGPQARGRARPF